MLSNKTKRSVHSQNKYTMCPNKVKRSVHSQNKYTICNQDFLDRGLLLTRKLLNQGFLFVRLKSSLGKFDGSHDDLVNCYRTSVSQMTTNMFYLCNHNPVLSSFMTYHRVSNKSNMMCGNSGAGTAYPSGAHEFIPSFW